MTKSGWKIWFTGLAFVVAVGIWISVAGEEEFPCRGLSFEPEDRILVMAPHPDDEVIGCGGIIQKALAEGIPLRILFLTNGDCNELSFLVYRKHPVIFPKSVRKMGLVRHDEAVAAAAVFGLSPDHLTFLGYPDFRTLSIWYAHWGDRPPAESILTKVRKVPYQSAFRPGAPYKGQDILRDIKTILKDFKPTRIFLSHPADNNRDHRALYLFTTVAIWELREEISPKLYPYLVHFKKWPVPRGYRPDQTLVPPDSIVDRIRWGCDFLDSEEVGVKHRALEKHSSQWKYSKKFLSSFVRPNESFGDFPEVRLVPGGKAISLNPDLDEDVNDIPEQLSEEERKSFLGIEERFIQLDEDRITVSVDLSRRMAMDTRLSIYVFGYRDDRDFAEMPKLRIQFRKRGFTVYDQNKKIAMEALTVRRKLTHVTVSIPLKDLGDPYKILTSARTHLEEVPLDWAAWRKIRVTEEGRSRETAISP